MESPSQQEHSHQIQFKTLPAPPHTKPPAYRPAAKHANTPRHTDARGEMRAGRQADALGDAHIESQDLAGRQMLARRLTRRDPRSQQGTGRHAGTHRSKARMEHAGKHKPKRGAHARDTPTGMQLQTKSHGTETCRQRQMQTQKAETDTQTELIKTSGSANSKRY